MIDIAGKSKGDYMKRKTVIIAILIMLFAMSAAYAAWTDSVSVGVSAENALMIMGITSRSASPSNRMTFTSPDGTPSLTNPVSDYTESITSLKGKNNGAGYTVTYTITNIGSTPLSLDGISIEDKNVTFPNANQSSYTATLRVSYTLEIPSTGYYDSVLVTDFDNHDSVSFAGGSTNRINVNDYCTLTVFYYRLLTGSKTIDKTAMNFDITSELEISAY